MHLSSPVGYLLKACSPLNNGPNFPLSGKNTYGYDLSSMLEDFSNVVPSEKLVIVFGLFGYDWEVDQKNESVKNGVPLSFIEIKQQFIDTCSEKNCQKSTDVVSQETKIAYSSSDGKPHIIWFEDPRSIAQKKAFLESKGFNATAIWAYSYY
jgi:spore germination protein